MASKPPRKKSSISTGTSVSRKGSGTSAESLQTRTDDPRLAFEKTCKELKDQLNAHKKSHETLGGVRGLTESPRAICEDNDRLLEELFKLLQRLNGDVPKHSTIESYRPEVRFRHAVISRPSRDSRARILFALIDLKIAPDSPTWSHFVRSLCLHDIDSSDVAFRDSGLPFKDVEFIGRFIGPSDAEAFKKTQLTYCEPISPEFDVVFDEIKYLITKTYSTCARCKTEDECQTIGHPEHIPIFCPDSEPAQLVETRSDLIRKIYVESQKKTVLECYPGDIAKQYAELESVDERATNFLRGVQRRAKIFATLIDIGVHATSEIWKAFMQICLEDVHPNLRFCDAHLPVSSKFAQRHLGQTDTARFCQSQYIFCPAILEEYEPRDTTTPLQSRLPLTLKQSIKETKVFRVKIAAHHFRDESGELNHLEKDFVMKQVNPKETDETGKLAFIFKQPLTHESIMRARASVKIEGDLYIFFNRAECDLYDFMTKDNFNAAGPRDYEERIRYLRYIAEVADALRYLHNLMQGEDKKKYSCYHKDIKANNILVTRRGDRLVFQITDFGISSIKEMEHKDARNIYENNRYSHSSDSSRRQSTPNERIRFCHNCAPEAYLQHKVTASADIWAYGTVLAEYVAWLAGGHESLLDFEAKRELKNVKDNDATLDSVDWSFDPTNDPPILNKGIETWFKDLIQETRERCPTDDHHVRLYEYCWDLLKDRILVCNPKQRARINEVNERLTEIISYATADKSGATSFRYDIGDNDSPCAVDSMESRPDLDTTDSLHGGVVADSLRSNGDVDSIPDVNVTSSSHASSTSIARSIEAPRDQTLQSSMDPPQPTNWTTSGDTTVLHHRASNFSPARKSGNWLKKAIMSQNKRPKSKAAAADTATTAMSRTMSEQGRADEDNVHVKELQMAIANGNATGAMNCLSEIRSNESLAAHAGPLLHKAVDRNMANVVIALMDRGIHPDTLYGKSTALQTAMRTSNIEDSVIRALLEHGADTEVQDTHEATPILIALRNHQQRAAGILLGYGANAIVQEKHGWAPLQYAVKLRSTQSTKALLRFHKEVAQDTEDTINAALQICAEDCTTFSVAHADIVLKHGVQPSIVHEILEKLRSESPRDGMKPERARMIKLLAAYDSNVNGNF